MRLKFIKMHGLGNDFVVLDALTRPLDLTQGQLARIADRHFGVGCDQVLVVEPPRLPHTDFHYRIFNADGGEVEQCGNGARCFVRYVRERGVTYTTETRVGTRAGLLVPRHAADGRLAVDRPVPRSQPARVPLEAPAPAPTYALGLTWRRIEVTALSMVTPHADQVVPDVQ